MPKWIVRLLIVVFWCVWTVYIYGLGGLAGMHAPDLVARSAKLAESVVPLVMALSNPNGEFVNCPEDALECGYDMTNLKTEVDCGVFQEENPRHAVLFTFGQSNSANAGRDRHAAGPTVANYNVHDGKCYHATDPLLGPDGSGGSVWGVLADKLIATGNYDRVLIVPFGIGATEIERWAPGGDLHVRVEEAARQMQERGIRPTQVLWHQGEADSVPGTRMSSAAFYTEKFTALVRALRDYGIDAPIFPAVASRCFDREGNEEVRTAQRQLPARLEGVFPGADTETVIGPAKRHDDCHFTALGMHDHANLWEQAIQAQRDAAPAA